MSRSPGLIRSMHCVGRCPTRLQMGIDATRNGRRRALPAPGLTENLMGTKRRNMPQVDKKMERPGIRVSRSELLQFPVINCGMKKKRGQFKAQEDFFFLSGLLLAITSSQARLRTLCKRLRAERSRMGYPGKAKGCRLFGRGGSLNGIEGTRPEQPENSRLNLFAKSPLVGRKSGT